MDSGANFCSCRSLYLVSLDARNPANRPLILYTYFETEKARFNLEFFIAHGLHGAADFVFILSGENEAEKIIPKNPNIRYIKRLNDCYDLGAYSETLLRDDLYKKYQKFILLNASLRGPFVPYWAEACWSDMYLKRITDEVKLVGITANCSPQVHVQSMILATDRIGIEVLLFPPAAAVAKVAQLPPVNMKGEFNLYPGINGCFHEWGAAVSAEIGTSAVMNAAGYKLDVMMSAYHNGKEFEQCNSIVDFLNENTYYGISYHPYETLFFKTNRVIDELMIERYTDWTNGRKYSSYDFCK
ncbi:hypothetical protein B0O99DRAFT_698234 [Bisporella sp. PMI_857]|nr:hypothetical protein B0O99DRAFT_698234 [Bisporella sp. PMI_857]